jgi:hypothetical protein
MTLPLSDEGRPVPRRVILSAQAGSDARGAGDNTELSDLTIQTVRTTRYFTRAM